MSFHDASDAVRSALLVLICLILTKCYQVGTTLTPILQGESGNTERLSNLPEVTQLESELGSLTSWLLFETAPYSMSWWDRIRTRLWSRQAATQ